MFLIPRFVTASVLFVSTLSGLPDAVPASESFRPDLHQEESFFLTSDGEVIPTDCAFSQMSQQQQRYVLEVALIGPLTYIGGGVAVQDYRVKNLSTQRLVVVHANAEVNGTGADGVGRIVNVLKRGKSYNDEMILSGAYLPSGSRVSMSFYIEGTVPGRTAYWTFTFPRTVR